VLNAFDDRYQIPCERGSGAEARGNSADLAGWLCKRFEDFQVVLVQFCDYDKYKLSLVLYTL
jgi:hypothetical protein